MGVYEILDRVQDGTANLSDAYVQKQIHRIPDATSVDRMKFLVDRCAGRTVLDVGYASGDLHSKIAEVAREAYGLDQVQAGDPKKCVVMDLDDLRMPDTLPFEDELGIEVVVCGEVLEHLSNPGWLLGRIARTFPDATLLVTVPNAFAAGSKRWLSRGIENVNVDHAWWPSWHTMKVMLGRCGYDINEFFWYGGAPIVAEGMIFVCTQRSSSDGRASEDPGVGAGDSDDQARDSAPGG